MSLCHKIFDFHVNDILNIDFATNMSILMRKDQYSRLNINFDLKRPIFTQKYWFWHKHIILTPKRHYVTIISILVSKIFLILILKRKNRFRHEKIDFDTRISILRPPYHFDTKMSLSHNNIDFQKMFKILILTQNVDFDTKLSSRQKFCKIRLLLFGRQNRGCSCKKGNNSSSTNGQSSISGFILTA